MKPDELPKWMTDKDGNLRRGAITRRAEAAEARAEEAEARAERLRAALETVVQELGVPGDRYPAPIANAYRAARAALNPNPTPEDEG